MGGRARYGLAVGAQDAAGGLRVHDGVVQGEREREERALLGEGRGLVDAVLDVDAGRVVREVHPDPEPAGAGRGALVDEGLPDGVGDAVHECRRRGGAAGGEQVHGVVGDGLAGLVVERAGRRVLVVDVAVEADGGVLADHLPAGGLVDDGGDARLAQVDRDAQVVVLQDGGVGGQVRSLVVPCGGTGAGDDVQAYGSAGRYVPDGHVQEPAGRAVTLVGLGLLLVGQRRAGARVAYLDRVAERDGALRQEEPQRLGAGPAAGVHRVERGQCVAGRGEGLAEQGGGGVQEGLGVVVGAHGLGVLPVPLLLAGSVAVVSVGPGSPAPQVCSLNSEADRYTSGAPWVTAVLPGTPIRWA